MSNKRKMIVSGITGAVDVDAEKINNLGLFFDEKEARAHAYRKRNWHPTKGKRRMKGSYDYDYYV